MQFIEYVGEGYQNDQKLGKVKVDLKKQSSIVGHTWSKRLEGIH